MPHGSVKEDPAPTPGPLEVSSPDTIEEMADHNPTNTGGLKMKMAAVFP